MDGGTKPHMHQPIKLSLSWQLLKRFYRVAIAYFLGSSKWKARGIFALMLLLCGTTTGLFVVISYTQRDFSTALSEKKKKEFYLAVWKFIGIIIVATPLFAVYDYVQGLMALEWRVWLTDEMLNKYFANRAYFDIKMEGTLDNPDQRISEDVRDFTGATVNIIIAITGKILNMGAFAGVLWSISPNLVYFLLMYSLVCVYVSLRVFGKKLMLLHFESLQREADFRYSLVRVRENAESIAFYKGEGRESSSTKAFFSALVDILHVRLVWLRHLSLFQNLYEYATIVIPSLIIAPRYFAGEVEFGVVMQTGFAFRTILYALTFIIQRFDELSGLAAQTERLESLISVLSGATDKKGSTNPGTKITIESPGSETLRKRTKSRDSYGEGTPLLSLAETSPGQPLPEKISREQSEGLDLVQLSITTPNLRTTLFPEGLQLSLSPGESLLVMGPSGCGKSSLLRAIAGLWSFGSGTIKAPPPSSTFFLPQKPYMPLGSLRAQLLFPSDEEALGSSRDAELLETLRLVALGDLARTVGGLDARRDWSDVLSTGEQQRIAFARLLVQQPEMAFLDEASSALDGRNEANLYGLVKQRVRSFVSVGHRTSLVKFHSLVLFYDEDDGWRVVKASEFESK